MVIAIQMWLNRYEPPGYGNASFGFEESSSVGPRLMLDVLDPQTLDSEGLIGNRINAFGSPISDETGWRAVRHPAGLMTTERIGIPVFYSVVSHGRIVPDLRLRVGATGTLAGVASPRLP
jgi:hypothetical protein